MRLRWRILTGDSPRLQVSMDLREAYALGTALVAATEGDVRPQARKLLALGEDLLEVGVTWSEMDARDMLEVLCPDSLDTTTKTGALTVRAVQAMASMRDTLAQARVARKRVDTEWVDTAAADCTHVASTDGQTREDAAQ